MKNKKTFYFTLLFMLILFLINIIQDNNDEKKRIKESDIYVKNLHLKLIGKINDYAIMDHDLGMLRLDVIYSSLKYYDVRGKLKKYLCVIKNNQAEVLGGDISLLEIGDSVVIDTDKDLYKIYRENELILRLKCGIGYKESFFNKFRKLHHL